MLRQTYSASATLVRVAILTFFCVVTSCGEPPVTVSRLAASASRTNTISDAVHSGGNPGFFFLPPMVPAPSFVGQFDAGVEATVQICLLTSSGCNGDPVAIYSRTSGPGSETIRVVDQHYIVNWHTDRFPIAPDNIYRITVAVAGNRVGFADVQVVATAGAARNVATSEYVPLVDGRTLPIKFRIERGMIIAVSVSPNPATVVRGRTIGFAAELVDAHGATVAGQTVAWLSTQPGIATVDATGTVSAVAVGNVEIVASASGVSGSAVLDVIRPPVASITLSPSNVDIIAGGQVQLTATLYDEDQNFLNDRSVTWSTSDASVAQVDADGLVTTAAAGDVTITATSEGRHASAVLSVKPAVATVRVDPATATLAIAQTLQLNATTLASDGTALTGRATTWATLTPSVVQIDATGLVTAVGVGTATVTATAEGRTGTATVTVPNRLDFVVPPSTTYAGSAIYPAIKVVVRDPSGGVLTSYNGPVTLSIGANPAAGTLSGVATVNANSGTAVFSNIRIDRAGSGYTLTASAASFTPATSDAFAVQPFLLMSVVPGYNHTCALTPEGQPFCWGYHTGIGTQPTDCCEVHAPVSPNTTLAFTSISTAHNVSCAISPHEGAYCWGSGGMGQLGAGRTTFSAFEVLPVAGGHSFGSLSTGIAGPRCAVTTGGQGYCWGPTDPQILGTTAVPEGSYTDTPVLVQGGHTFLSLTAGVTFTCGLTGAGTYCWGSNNFGELGPRPPQGSVTPVAVATPLFTSLSAGQAHACGLTTTGQIFCWGRNNAGQLGNGTQTNSAAPVQLASAEVFASVSSGIHYACGLTTTGAVYCWGDGQYGQLGHGSMSSSTTPVRAAPGLTFQTLRTGSYTTCATTAQGEGYCWGLNDRGQLGNGTTQNSSTPVRISSPTRP